MLRTALTPVKCLIEITLLLGLFIPLTTIFSLLVSLFDSIVGLFSTTIPSRATLGRVSSVLITGASSGIGEAIAKEFAERSKAQRKKMRLFICGRDEERLRQVKHDCEQLSDQFTSVDSQLVNVEDRTRMQEWIQGVDSLLPNGLDLVFANAATSEYQIYQQDPNATFEEATRKVFQVNLDGVYNTIFPAIQLFNKRNSTGTLRDPSTSPLGGQHIIITGSMSHYLANVISGYSCTKSFIHDFGRFLRVKLRPNRIHVNVVVPGWVNSRMSDAYPGYKLFKWSASDAAQYIINGVEDNREIIVFPWFLYIFAKYLITWLPYELFEPIAKWFCREPATTIEQPIIQRNLSADAIDELPQTPVSSLSQLHLLSSLSDSLQGTPTTSPLATPLNTPRYQGEWLEQARWPIGPFYIHLKNSSLYVTVAKCDQSPCPVFVHPLSKWMLDQDGMIRNAQLGYALDVEDEQVICRSVIDLTDVQRWVWSDYVIATRSGATLAVEQPLKPRAQLILLEISSSCEWELVQTDEMNMNGGESQSAQRKKME